jgi:hypothetical protein
VLAEMREFCERLLGCCFPESGSTSSAPSVVDSETGETGHADATTGPDRFAALPLELRHLIFAHSSNADLASFARTNKSNYGIVKDFLHHKAVTEALRLWNGSVRDVDPPGFDGLSRALVDLATNDLELLLSLYSLEEGDLPQGMKSRLLHLLGGTDLEEPHHVAALSVAVPLLSLLDLRRHEDSFVRSAVSLQNEAHKARAIAVLARRLPDLSPTAQQTLIEETRPLTDGDARQIAIKAWREGIEKMEVPLQRVMTPRLDAMEQSWAG